MEASLVRSGVSALPFHWSICPFKNDALQHDAFGVGRHICISILNIWSFLIGQNYIDENKYEQKIYILIITKVGIGWFPIVVQIIFSLK